MSMKTFLEAFESVLADEVAGRCELIVFRPGARHALEESERDIALPRVGKMSLSIALGAAMTGMHPVLDLRSDTGSTEWLMDSLCGLPAGAASALTVVTDAEDADVLEDIPGVFMMNPQSPRQAVGFTRAALRSDRLTVLILDRALYEEEDDVPEESDFMMLPLEEEIQIPEDDEAPEAEAEVNTDETDALPEEPVEPDDLQVGDVSEGECKPESRETRSDVHQTCFCATRMTSCDLTRLYILADELDMPRAELIGRCMEHVQKQIALFDWQYEADARRGECAFLPPAGEKASLWLGSDALTVSYDAENASHADAAALLRTVRRVLEKPTLLIYDKESESR